MLSTVYFTYYIEKVIFIIINDIDIYIVPTCGLFIHYKNAFSNYYDYISYIIKYFNRNIIVCN